MSLKRCHQDSSSHFALHNFLKTSSPGNIFSWCPPIFSQNNFTRIFLLLVPSIIFSKYLHQKILCPGVLQNFVFKLSSPGLIFCWCPPSLEFCLSSFLFLVTILWMATIMLFLRYHFILFDTINYNVYTCN